MPSKILTEDDFEAARQFLRDNAVDGKGMTQREYHKSRPRELIGTFPIQKRFGWSAFVESAGLIANRVGGEKSETAFQAAVDVCKRILARDGHVTREGYHAERGDAPSCDVLAIKYGSWNAFLERHNLPLSPRGRPRQNTRSAPRILKGADEEEQAEIIATMRANAHPAGSELQPLRMAGVWESRRYYCWTRRCWYTCEATQVAFE